LGNCGERDLQAVTQIHMIGTRAGRLSQAYQVQKTIPDRHEADCNRTYVLVSMKMKKSKSYLWVFLI